MFIFTNFSFVLHWQGKNSLQLGLFIFLISVDQFVEICSMSQVEVARKILAHVIGITVSFGDANGAHSWSTSMIFHDVLNLSESLKIRRFAKRACESRRVLLGFHRVVNLLFWKYVLLELLILIIYELLTCLSMWVLLAVENVLSASTFHRESCHL